jgi:hypothetical protein
MNKYLIVYILLHLVTWNTRSVAAQEVILKGSYHRYSISPVNTNANYKYIWSVTGGTTSVFGNGSISEPILWDGPPGFYTISVFPSDIKTGCAGNFQNFHVQVIDFFVRWQGISTTICSAWENEERDFSIVVEFSKTSSPWSFNYQIDDNKPVKVIINGDTTMMINISRFINRSSTNPETHKIRITNITIPQGHHFTFDGTESDAAAHIYTVMVNPAIPDGNIEFVRDL